MLAEIGAAVGTFLVLTWFTINTVTAVVRLLGVSTTDARLPEIGVWVAILAVAAVGTIWLERGGYHRLRADATAGGDFAWLAICYLPFTFLPAGYALFLLVDLPIAVVHLYLVACVLVAGWLAFYDGLERIGVGTAQFGWAFLSAFAASIAVVVLTSTVPIGSLLEAVIGSWSIDDPVRAVTALLGQGLVLQYGFGDVRRDS